MSIEWKSNVSSKQLVQFLSDEYKIGSDIPVHLFSVVNAAFSSYNKSLGITDGAGTIFLECSRRFKSYGSGNPIPMIRALRHCNIQIS